MGACCRIGGFVRAHRRNLFRAGDCPLGARCCSAHGLAELRVRAAINLGTLPASYKTQRCRAFDTKAGCPLGAPSAAQTCLARSLMIARMCHCGSVAGLGLSSHESKAPPTLTSHPTLPDLSDSSATRIACCPP